MTREQRAADLVEDWALDIADGGCTPDRKICATDFIEALCVDDEDIANLICGVERTQTRLQRAIEEKALAFFRDDRRGQQMIEDALVKEDEERERDDEAEREYQNRRTA